METKPTSAAIKGVILSLVLIVFSLVTIYTDQMQNRALGIIPIVILLGGVIWGCVTYSKQMDHNVTFGNIFAHGFKMTAAVIAIMAIYTLLLFLVINPGLKEVSLEQARAEMEKQANLSDSDRENAIQMTERLFLPITIGSIIIIYGLVGCIAALIGGAVSKKNPNPTPFNR